MNASADIRSLQPVDENLIDGLRPGMHLFCFANKSTSGENPTGDYVLYSVLEVTPEQVKLTAAFDEMEREKVASREQLLAGYWYYNPQVNR
jgi:hypothetical protein